MQNHWSLIGLLAVTTYGSRLIGLELMAEREMSPTLRSYFNFVPVAIISALVIRQILVPVDGKIGISLPVLVACLATAVLIKKTKLFLPSVLAGGIIGLLARHFLT